MLNNNIREALESELEYLLSQRQRLVEKIDAKIKALHTVLEPMDGLGLFQDSRPLDTLIRSAEAISNADISDSSNGGKERGLRSLVFEILASRPSGLNASDLAEKVEAMGWSPKGKSTTKILVSSDLYRLRGQGKLKKRGKKWFLPEYQMTS